MSNYPSFEEWFNVFFEQVNKLGYSGPVDKDAFESDFVNESDPYYCAQNFIDDMSELNIELKIKEGNK